MLWRLLGPVALLGHDGQPVDLGTPQQRTVLAALLLEPGKLVPVPRLIQSIWDERPPRSAVKSLHGYVHRLRRVLSPLGAAGLRTSGDGYLLDVPPDQVDLHQFRRLTNAAAQSGGGHVAVDLLERALALWQGPALAGVHSDTLRNVAAQLDEERVAAQEQRLAAELGIGRHERCLPELNRLVLAEPLREQTRALLMLALSRCGRQAEALAVFRAGRDLLRDELGMEPGEDLRRLHGQILRGELEAPPGTDASLDAGSGMRAAMPGERAGARSGHDPARAGPVPPERGAQSLVPRQLPAVSAEFTGRRDDLDRLDELAWPGGGVSASVVVVHGAAGIGKTSLVVHWAQRRRDRFPDGQLYLDLRGFDPDRPPMSPIAALGALLRALSGADQRLPADLDEQAALLRTLLAGRRVLLMLDNVADADQVRPLLPGAPECTAILTSRRRLAGLAARDGAARLALDVLAVPEAIELITRIIGADRAQAQPDSIAELAGLCGYLPLAVRIVADQLHDQRDQPPAELAIRLFDERHRLDGLATDDDIVGVRAAFALSYETLKPPAARAFRLLGLHAGPSLGLGAAGALFACDPPEAARLMSTLVERHLVERAGSDRYVVHDLLRVYAAELVRLYEAEPERSAATRRLLSWYLDGAVLAGNLLAPHRPVPPPVHPEMTAAAPPAASEGHADALRWCDLESANLVASVHHAVSAGHDDIAWRLPVALYGYFDLRKPWADWLGTHEAGLAAARRAGDRRGEATLLGNLGIAYYYPRRFTDALDYYHRALGIWREIGDGMGLATATICVGNVHLELRELDEAIACYEKALGFLPRTGAVGLRSVVHTNLAEAGCLLGRFDYARKHGYHALAGHRATGNRRMEALTLGHVANALTGVLRLDEALNLLADALTLSREDGDRQAEGWTLHYLAVTLHGAGRRGEAREYWSAAIEHFDALGDPQADDIRALLGDSAPPR
jgi:DNA-binding SARP family transcriptional activator/tetratricopeptide (TPR) repeat protein